MSNWKQGDIAWQSTQVSKLWYENIRRSQSGAQPLYTQQLAKHPVSRPTTEVPLSSARQKTCLQCIPYLSSMKTQRHLHFKKLFVPFCMSCAFVVSSTIWRRLVLFIKSKRFTAKLWYHKQTTSTASWKNRQGALLALLHPASEILRDHSPSDSCVWGWSVGGQFSSPIGAQFKLTRKLYCKKANQWSAWKTKWGNCQETAFWSITQL